MATRYLRLVGPLEQVQLTDIHNCVSKQSFICNTYVLREFIGGIGPSAQGAMGGDTRDSRIFVCQTTEIRPRAALRIFYSAGWPV
jgi:hypothetical protein